MASNYEKQVFKQLEEVEELIKSEKTDLTTTSLKVKYAYERNYSNEKNHST